MTCLPIYLLKYVYQFTRLPAQTLPVYPSTCSNMSTCLPIYLLFTHLPAQACLPVYLLKYVYQFTRLPAQTLPVYPSTCLSMSTWGVFQEAGYVKTLCLLTLR